MRERPAVRLVQVARDSAKYGLRLRRPTCGKAQPFRALATTGLFSARLRLAG